MPSARPARDAARNALDRKHDLTVILEDALIVLAVETAKPSAADSAAWIARAQSLLADAVGACDSLRDALTAAQAEVAKLPGAQPTVPGTAAAGDASAILSAWRTVIDDVNGLATERTPISTAVPRLLAAVDAALACHERVNLYGNAATEEEPGNCPHHPDSDLHFEDPNGSTEWLCKGRHEGSVCSSCTDEDGLPVAFPCREREDILNALTGKAAGDA